MGTVVYQNLVEFLLEEGDKTEEEIVEEAMKRFEFPNKDELTHEVRMQFIMGKDFFQKLENEKYRLLKLDNSPITGRKAFLELLNNSPEGYFDTRPHIKKLYDALENKMVAGL